MNVHAEVAAAEDHKEDYKDGLAEHGECLSVLDGKRMVKDAYCAAVSDAKDNWSIQSSLMISCISFVFLVINRLATSYIRTNY